LLGAKKCGQQTDEDKNMENGPEMLNFHLLLLLVLNRIFKTNDPPGLEEATIFEY
jgi:hypothetical protein